MVLLLFCRGVPQFEYKKRTTFEQVCYKIYASFHTRTPSVQIQVEMNKTSA